MVNYLIIKPKHYISLGKLLSKGKSCKTIKDSNPSATTGIYEVDVPCETIKLVCDMDISGGGWAVSSLFVCNDH